MLYVDTGGLDRCYPEGKPPLHSGEQLKQDVKLQLYVEKLPALIPAMY